MADAPSPFSSIPGFEFMQNLVKNAGSALPSIGQWVAPTLDPQELTKRIEELKTVQFWLEQNARMMGATIQALEVQRMTLSTLKTMNVQVKDLHEALKIKVPPMAAPAPAPEAEVEAPEAPPAEAPAAAPAGVVDPMQWWGALAKQFTELATEAIKDGTAHAAQVAQMAKLNPGATPAAAGAAPQADAAPAAAKKAAKKAAKPAAGVRRKAGEA